MFCGKPQIKHSLTVTTFQPLFERFFHSGDLWSLTVSQPDDSKQTTTDARRRNI